MGFAEPHDLDALEQFALDAAPPLTTLDRAWQHARSELTTLFKEVETI
jgi:hypothetical protein